MVSDLHDSDQACWPNVSTVVGMLPMSRLCLELEQTRNYYHLDMGQAYRPNKPIHTAPDILEVFPFFPGNQSRTGL